MKNSNEPTKLKPWSCIEFKGFTAVGHKGSVDNVFETITIGLPDGKALEIEGVFQVISNGDEDALIIRKAEKAKIRKE